MVDLSEIARDAGLPGRPFATRAVWSHFSSNDAEVEGPTLQNKLLFMLRSLHAALTERKGPKKEVIYFSTYLENSPQRVTKLMLKAAVKDPSSAQPIIYVMLEGEREVDGFPKGKGGRIKTDEGKAHIR